MQSITRCHKARADWIMSPLSLASLAGGYAPTCREERLREAWRLSCTGISAFFRIEPLTRY